MSKSYNIILNIEAESNHPEIDIDKLTEYFQYKLGLIYSLLPKTKDATKDLEITYCSIDNIDPELEDF